MRDDPAFPTSSEHGSRGDYYTVSHPGLTKRELFAAMAIQGLLSASAHENTRGVEPAALIKGAVRMADMLIAELEKQS